jgi:hypothetical protein
MIIFNMNIFTMLKFYPSVSGSFYMMFLMNLVPQLQKVNVFISICVLLSCMYSQTHASYLDILKAGDSALYLVLLGLFDNELAVSQSFASVVNGWLVVLWFSVEVTRSGIPSYPGPVTL